MLPIPNSYRELEPSAALLFLNMHIDAATTVVKAGTIPVLGETLSRRDLVALGIERFNGSRAARQLPRPWAAKVAEFVPLDVTPCTRSVFASITGQSGAARVEREDVVSLCIAHDTLRSLDQPIVYADRLCTRDDAKFSGDRDLLRAAPWDRIKRRDFRPDPGSPSTAHRYEASVFVWGAIPMTAVQAIVCKSAVAVDRLRGRCPNGAVPLMARADLLW